MARLIREIHGAMREISREPGTFIRNLFSADNKDAKRRQRIYAGLVLAVAAHAASLSLIAVLGWQTMFVKTVDNPSEYRVIYDLATSPHKTESPGSEAPRDGVAGSGGGQQRLSPASKGVPPRALLQLPIVNPNPSTIPEPTLAILPNVVAPEAPPPPGQIGDPSGKSGEFSGGPGSKGGIGRGDGTGVGGGNDSGANPGGTAAKRGGAAGSPEGTGSTISDMSFNTKKPAGFTQFDWIYRARAIITPEAQANKVFGTVLLLATFRADGTITDIEVVNPVPFMTESAIESLSRCKFRPAMINGVPVTLRRVPVHINVHY